MTKPKKTPKILQLLLSEDTPLEMRMEILKQLVTSEDEKGSALLQQLLEAARAAKSKDLFAAKTEELSKLIGQMMEGPLRQGTFVSLIRSEAFGLRAEVLLQDGASAFTSVPDKKLARELRRGDLVWLEAQGKALLYRQEGGEEMGDEARIERRFVDGTVEVQVGEMGRFVYRTSEELESQLESGEAGPGSTVIVCPRRRFAFRALPSEDGLAHFRYLCREPVPGVVVERDIGAPPEFLGSFTRHLRRELSDRTIGEAYGMRRSAARLLTGVPGTGKTFSIQGFWNRMYAVLSERSGIPVEDLPPRVMQLRGSDLLSKWVGSSERNIARFFEEAEKLAAERLVLADGTELEMPLLLIVEECDAWARERGENAIHDRIQATLLQRLDPIQPLFRDHLVFVLCTTNTPHLIDTAFVRRVGARVETFGRLRRADFRSVLGKQLARRRFRIPESGSVDDARARCVADLVAWLFASDASKEPVCELTYVGQTTSVAKCHRDFLTAALVDRALQEACEGACNAEWLGTASPGLDTLRLMRALDGQVRQIVRHLTERTCDRHLTLPEGARVASVRRFDPPAVPAFELERDLVRAS